MSDILLGIAGAVLLMLGSYMVFRELLLADREEREREQRKHENRLRRYRGEF